MSEVEKKIERRMFSYRRRGRAGFCRSPPSTAGFWTGGNRESRFDLSKIAPRGWQLRQDWPVIGTIARFDYADCAGHAGCVASENDVQLPVERRATEVWIPPASILRIPAFLLSHPLISGRTDN